MSKEFDISRRKFIEYGAKSAAGLLLYPTPSSPVPDEGVYELPQPQETSQEILDRYLSALVAEIPDISGDEKYDLPLTAGVGYSTLHCLTYQTADYHGRSLRNWMSRNRLSEADLSSSQLNIFQFTDSGIKGMAAKLDDDQALSDPASALDSNRYIGLVATRSPSDIGSKYLAFGTTAEERFISPPRFIGAVLVVDCVARKHWLNGGSQRSYSYLGWHSLPWITEASPEVMEKFPPGVSGDPKNINCGRPGVVLVSQSQYQSLLSG